jgi:hypothetical protein
MSCSLAGVVHNFNFSHWRQSPSAPCNYQGNTEMDK